jgi:hypothetical protein
MVEAEAFVPRIKEAPVHLADLCSGTRSACAASACAVPSAASILPAVNPPCYLHQARGAHPKLVLG